MPWAHLRDLATAVMLAVAMILAGWLGLRTRVGAVIELLLSLVWLTVDRLWEGPTLLVVTSHHGFVAADAVGVIGIASSVCLLLRARRGSAARKRSSDRDIRPSD